MRSPIEIAYFFGYAGTSVLRVLFVLTIAALALIVRQPPKTTRRDEEK